MLDSWGKAGNESDNFPDLTIVQFWERKRKGLEMFAMCKKWEKLGFLFFGAVAKACHKSRQTRQPVILRLLLSLKYLPPKPDLGTEISISA